MKQREFLSVGSPIPELNWKEQGAFLSNFQEAILWCLEKRELLTEDQRERCLQQLEKQRLKEKW